MGAFLSVGDVGVMGGWTVGGGGGEGIYFIILLDFGENS